MSIPKKLHYVWVGGKEKPTETKTIIRNWSSMLGQEWEIKEWNEENFEINSVPFVKYHYERGNWAYVSDYIRAYAVYKEGGFYIDTDIELLRSFDELTKYDEVFSWTKNSWLTASSFGAIRNSRIIKEYLSVYENKWIIKHQPKVMSSDIMGYAFSKFNNAELNGETQIFKNTILLDERELQLNVDGKGYSIHHHHDNWKGKKTELVTTKYYNDKLQNYKNTDAIKKESKKFIKMNNKIKKILND